MEALKLPFVMCLGLIGMVSIMGAPIQTQTPIRLSPTPESDSEILFSLPAARIREGKQTRIRRKSYGNNGRF